MVNMEELINKVITKVGIPLPSYSYIEKKFQIHLPMNIPNGNDGVTGIEAHEYYDTFSEALEGIISWYDEQFTNK